MDGAAFDTSVPLLVVKIGRYPLHHGGVGAIRTLGRVGVPVYAVTEDRFTPAALSRHLRGRFVARTTGFEDDEQLLATYSAIGRAIGRPTIALPTDDEAAVFLAEHAAELAPWFVIPAVPKGLTRRLASKRGLHELCAELAIPAPDAAFPETVEAVLQYADTAEFPVVAKNIDPWNRLREPVVSNSTVVRTRAALRELARTWPDSPGVMLQEYLPSDTAEDWIFHGYCDATAECVVGFTGVKYRSWPPRAGVTSYARIVTNEVLARKSAHLCRRLGYRGIVDLDWRFDRRDQRYKLLDFNPRVGAQFRLFETTAGIDVVRAMHLDLTGRNIPTGGPSVGRGYVVEYLDAPAQLAYRLLGAAPEPVPHVPGPIEPAWFARDDPLPSLAAALRSAAPVAQRLRRLGALARRRAQAAMLRRRAASAAPMRRDANSVPYTNRNSGPNVAAAVSPVKKSPGSVDSNDRLSTGEPATLCTPAASAGLMKPSVSRSTR
jgi:D-aspartate ligase